MATGPSRSSMNRSAVNGARNRSALSAEPENGEGSSAPNQVAHTLTACTRCRSRKTRCDPGLPKCTPCERTNSVCEYFDSTRGCNVNRNYVVYLQHKVRELEEELERLENEDGAEDPEALMRAGHVRVHEAKESKYLGPSSGIAITRLVMQLAKQFTEAKSIKDIVPPDTAAAAKELYNNEQAKPTSKIYPLISNVAAEGLLDRPLTDSLVHLYKIKVQPMYPALHEPTLDKDVDIVYNSPDEATPAQNFIVRMVIAVALQKTITSWAGLGDSFYLAALQYLEPVVKPMDLKTLQCFALMAEYSLLTPTRTAIYYVVGIAVRLAQALGLNEEKTITRGRADGTVDYLEIDMRRRLFWCTMVMDYGLAHSLGRPSMLATSQEHIDVGWFETCDDQYITSEGIDPAAPRPSLKKWVCIHFFKMRMLQLEIRRKLYLRKQPDIKDDSDPWFVDMDAKLTAWRDTAPENVGDGSGLDKVWFIGRYNTMIVFLYRPSPQVPRPSLQAALKCFEACKYNIHMQREQIDSKSVDLTWIFTQSIFMAINTILWSLSYVEVRRMYKREEVERHLDVAMVSIQDASERWPGVASAVQLYQNLILAIMKIYDKDGDIPISATTPSEAPSPGSMFPDIYNRSSTTSPSNQSVSTPPERPPPFGYLPNQNMRGMDSPVTQHKPYSGQTQSSSESVPTMHNYQRHTGNSFDLNHQFDSLPEFTADLTIPSWSAACQAPMPFASASAGNSMHGLNGYGAYDPSSPEYIFSSGGGVAGQGYGYDGYASGGVPQNDPYAPQFWDMDSGWFGSGLTQAEQEELMQRVHTDGMEDIQTIISSSLPPPPPPNNHSLQEAGL